MTFDEIYQTISGAFEPQPRNLLQIGVILKEIDRLSKHPRFDIPIDTDDYRNEQIQLNTIIARILHEIENVRTEDKGQFFSSSEGIERAISQIKTFKIMSYTPEPENSYFQFLQISGALNALKKYFIHSAREGLVFTRKKIITDKLYKLSTKNKKLNYLNEILISLKQSKNTWDSLQFEKITEFLELEIQKWNLMNDDVSEEISFSSCNSLQTFIIDLIETKLKHNIKYDEGYRVFWRDEKCISNPKHEPEIQSYIKSVLKPYCDQKNIKISREVSIANGRIDLSFTYLGYTVCLEIKKAEHQDILTSLETQLTEYMKGEETNFGIYLILWYKNSSEFDLPKKYKTLEELINSVTIPQNSMNYKILGIDCTKPISPSKLK